MDDKTTQEPVKLSALIKESQPKKPKSEAPIVKNFYSKMTPKEYAAWRERSKNKANATRARKTKERLEIKEKAKQIMPSLLAAQLLSDDSKKHNWIPEQETIDQIKYLMSKNLTTDQMRKQHFPKVKDDVWQKIMKFVLRSSVSQSEDLGNAVFQAREITKGRLEKQLKDIQKQQKIWCKEKNTKLKPAYLLEAEMKTIARIAELDNDYAMTMHRAGIVGDKGKSPTMHVHLGTPRPQKEKIVESVEVNENGLVIPTVE